MLSISCVIYSFRRDRIGEWSDVLCSCWLVLGWFVCSNFSVDDVILLAVFAYSFTESGCTRDSDEEKQLRVWVTS